MTKDYFMLELTTQNFQHEILANDKPTLVYFFSPVGCAPCKILSPVVEKLHEELNDTVKMGRLNIYPNMPVTLKYNIMTAPVLLLFVKGEPVVRLQGYHPREKILDELNPYLTVG
jgi:thioredoxin 1